MDYQKRSTRLNIGLGCGLLALIFIVSLVGIISVRLSQERHALQFPGSFPVAHLTQTTAKPTYLRRDNGYLSEAPLPNIRNWYAETIGLHISEENDECVSLQGFNQGPILELSTSVTICNNGARQEIWITRITSTQ